MSDKSRCRWKPGCSNEASGTVRVTVGESVLTQVPACDECVEQYRPLLDGTGDGDD